MSGSPSGASEVRRGGLARVETLLGSVLRAGVAASVVLLVCGVAVSLARHPDYMADPQTLGRLIAPGAAFPHTLGDLFAELGQGRGRALATLGLLVLIITPVVRVIVSIVAMLRLGDRRFAVISGLVLLVLFASMLVGAV
ncbi:MAG TPA: DUF1634 domain-containing protein [Phycisphaerae bacterium]|nr:DUF1634 domain-containing protein [Phycisphaerales bacterium]HRX85642.1 DUF1634 domain-containing protein [Phycisphaerae bacterium]